MSLKFTLINNGTCSYNISLNQLNENDRNLLDNAAVSEIQLDFRQVVNGYKAIPRFIIFTNGRPALQMPIDTKLMIQRLTAKIKKMSTGYHAVTQGIKDIVAKDVLTRLCVNSNFSQLMASAQAPIMNSQPAMTTSDGAPVRIPPAPVPMPEAPQVVIALPMSPSVYRGYMLLNRSNERVNMIMGCERRIAEYSKRLDQQKPFYEKALAEKDRCIADLNEVLRQEAFVRKLKNRFVNTKGLKNQHEILEAKCKELFKVFCKQKERYESYRNLLAEQQQLLILAKEIPTAINNKQ